MKTALSIALLVLIFLSCQKNNNSDRFEPVQFGSFKEWWQYQNTEIDLASNFDGRSATNQTLTKKAFLDSLKTGKYIPVKHVTSTKDPLYILQAIEKNSDYFSPISQLAETYLYYLQWENKPFPSFDFVDLEGNTYTPENTKGKTIYLKTYFIACKACNEEMPELNTLVAQNEQNDQVIFLSLATDSPEKLKKFLTGKDYKYKFVANQRKFIEQQLLTNQYPTHFIIKDGIVKKVASSAKDVLKFL